MSQRIGRRSFIKGASLTALGTAINVREVLAEPENGLALQKDADRGGSQRYGFNEVVANVSGLPLGGIGAGSVEIRPDGYFHDWLIFNMGAWSPEQPDAEKGPSPDMGVDGLQFFVRCEQPGKSPQLRRLGVREDQTDLYSVAYALPVQGIRFDGKFPFATLEYLDDSLPIQVTGLAFAPIIPGDARTSGTPGFTVAFKVKNTSAHPINFSLMGALKNPLATGATDRALTNLVSMESGATTIGMSTAATGGRKSCHGTMAFSVTGDKTSYVCGAYPDYLGNGDWAGTRGYGSAHFSYLHAYYRDGRLPSLSGSQSLDDIAKGMSDSQIDSLSFDELTAIRKRLETDPFFHEFIARVDLIQPNLLDGKEALANLVKEARDRLNNFSGAQRDRSTWGDAALESSTSLQPGEEKEIRFVVSWFFPNHFSALGPNLGHQYEHWFTDATSVNKFLITNHKEHREKTINFAETLLTTNVDPEVAFAWSAQLTTLIKSSWWCKDGRFAIWEGLGCCGLHTTDITYQGSFPIISLFPELQMGQIKMGAAYQRADGRIPHFFSPDLLHVDNGFDRVDMNPQYVMMVCRDYLWTGDKAFARDNWPKVLRAMASTQKLDKDGDGIPDSDTRRNTYDQWDLEGSPAYICSLWLGALRSAIRLAGDLGETEQQATWAALLEKASKSFISRLWNGEYFNLWVSDTGKDECCMSDQLSGEWYTGLMGIGHSVPRDHMIQAVQSVFKNNFDSEFGLRNATYPPGKPKHFKTHQNLQAFANWTGIEYANAALMIELGMVEQGVEVMRSVYRRYVRSGRRWNHVECGDHYFRAMSSWTSLLALTGLKLDVPGASISILPQVEGLVAPWFVPTGYGVMSCRGKQIELDCRDGSLSVRELRLKAQGKRARITVDGVVIPSTSGLEGEHLVVKMAETFGLRSGSTARIVVSG